MSINHSNRDDVLDHAVRALRDAPVPDGPPPHTIDAILRNRDREGAHGGTTRATHSQTHQGRPLRTGSRHRLSRLTALAAAVLFAVTLGVHLHHRARLAAVANDHLRLIVTGPAKLQPGAPNEFTVQTRSVAGAAVPARIEYTVYDGDNKPLIEKKLDTDGSARIAIPADVAVPDGSRLEVLAHAGPALERMQTTLTVAHDRHATYLSVDKPLYRPGETVYFRSLTLSRYGLRNDREAAIRFEIHDPRGSSVFQLDGLTRRGVGNGAFPIPADMPGGEYTLVAHSLDGSFPEESRKFLVHRYRLPRIRKELELARDSYGPGDTVVADFSAERAEGGPVATAALRIIATVDGETVYNESANASEAGTHRIEFALPEEIDRGAAQLAVVVDDGGNQETIAKKIPITLDKLDIRFYPEGGDLVAGVENRVYFTARDPLGEPVHVAGEIVDAGGNQLADVETEHEGMGSFRFTPAVGGAYTLHITSPTGTTSRPALAAVTGSNVALSATKGVFAADAPLDLNIHATQAGLPLVVTAYCRGVLVGEQALTTQTGPNPVQLPLADTAGGVVRVTAYDYAASPPKPLAERLVYRHPQRRLDVELADASTDYTPGAPVNVSLRVTDETGKPALAVVGVAVVDEALLNLADDDKTPAMPTHLLLTTEVEHPAELEDADFYLSESPEAEAALDLLLGTQGWRRFVEKNLAAQRKDEATAEDADRLAALGGTVTPPVMFDNLAAARTRYERDLAALASTPATLVSTLALAASAALLLVTLTVLALLGLPALPRWSPTLAAALASTLLALVTLNAADTRPRTPQLAYHPFAPRDTLTQLSHRFRDLLANRVTHPTVRAKLADVLAQRFIRQAKNLNGLTQDDDVLALLATTSGGPANADFDSLMDLIRETLEPEAWDDVGGPGSMEPFPLNLSLMISEAESLDSDGDGVIMQFTPTWEEIIARRTAGNLRVPLVSDLPGPMGAAFRDDLDQLLLIMPDGKESNGQLGDRQARLRSLLARVRELEFVEQELRIVEADLDHRRSVLQKESVARWLRLDREQIEKLKQLREQLRFPVREYAHEHPTDQQEPGVRNDFTETVYWNPLLIADEDGLARISFDLSDSVTTFRVRADAHGDGRIGTGGGTIVSRMPFSLEPKLPVEVTAGDVIDVPLAVTNDTAAPVSVALALDHSGLLRLTGDAHRELTLAPHQRSREYFPLEVTGEAGEATLDFRGAADQLADGVRRSVRVVPPGFPVRNTYSGNLDGEQQLTLELPDQWVPGSLEVTLRAYPATLAELLSGTEEMLREPSGCFEQTSSSSYPNLLVLKYLREHHLASPAVTRRARELLAKGYARLVGFECPDGGFEWFGSDPAHEALTAYGLMQFTEMQEVFDVDAAMVERTRRWQLSRRDGHGGFLSSEGSHSFGSAPKAITDAYITWALASSGQNGLDAELDHLEALASDSTDPYLLALTALAHREAGQRTMTLLGKLAATQAADGRLDGAETSITRSAGRSLQVETTALAALAFLEDPAYRPQADKAVGWLTANRQGAGGFGSTQATVLALKALVEHARVNRHPVTPGELVVTRNGVAGVGATAKPRISHIPWLPFGPATATLPNDAELARQSFTADYQETITLTVPAERLTPGANRLTVALTGDNRMPYAFEVNYRTRSPLADPDCAVKLTTRLASQEVPAGQTVPLTAELTNTADREQPMALAILGLPAGLQVQSKQLEELKKSGTVDFYETRAREVILYWRGLAPSEHKTIHLDLIAALPGKYMAPASRAYLYYTPEHKHWSAPLAVHITRQR